MCVIVSNYNGYVVKCCTMWSLSAFYNIIYKFLFVNLPVSVFNVELECLFLCQECITELLFECFQSPSSLFFHENRLTDQHTVNLWSLKHSSNLRIVLFLFFIIITYYFYFFIFFFASSGFSQRVNMAWNTPKPPAINHLFWHLVVG